MKYSLIDLDNLDTHYTETLEFQVIDYMVKCLTDIDDDDIVDVVKWLKSFIDDLYLPLYDNEHRWILEFMTMPQLEYFFRLDDNKKLEFILEMFEVLTNHFENYIIRIGYPNGRRQVELVLNNNIEFARVS